MPLTAVCRVLKVSFAVLILALFVVALVPNATADPSGPKVLKVLNGTLEPGATNSFSWNLDRNVTDYVFYYKITGGTDRLDVAYVSIDETGMHWDHLAGEGWAYCDCALSAGSYTLTVQVDEGATGPVDFNLGFFLIPQPPVDFAGFIPVNSTARLSSFAAIFPTTSDYTLVLGVTSGSYEFFVDSISQAVVTRNTKVSLDFEAGSFHLFDISSISTDEDIGWSVQIQGQPKLQVKILNSCPILNPNSGQSVCITGAEASASDGGSPNVNYKWSASGGKFNSTTSQWVEWTAPPGVANFMISVQASAEGYVSDTDSLTVQVAPEFSPSSVALLIMVLLALTLVAQRRLRNQLQS
jgi:hypothetical protein